MSDPCTCPLAGYCERHSLTKNEHWHYLCQAKPNYRAAWDEGFGPGQGRRLIATAQLDRKSRIQERVAARDRLIGWLTFFRHPDEQGIGDTAHRIKQIAKPSHGAYEAIHKLLAQCSCAPVDAVAGLNKEYPYPTQTA